MISAETRGYLARFLSVGGVGFLVDAGIFQGLVWLDMGPIAARVVSTVFAVTVTWFLNRRHTFRTSGVSARGHEYLRYWVVHCIGLAINFGAFLIALDVLPIAREIPIIALCAGAAAALVFNFLGARYWAYRTESSCQ